MNAWCLVRPMPHYRRDAFEQGLKRVGYKLQTGLPHSAGAKDVVIFWNLNPPNENLAESVRKRGGAVLVAENGYIGRDKNGIQYYALAKNGHNGSGEWANGGPERFHSMGIELKPWRISGETVVAFLKRGIGSKRMASPMNWHDGIRAHGTKRKLVVVPHPGKPANDPAVTENAKRLLSNAHCCAIWSSANGVRALAEGVPVIYSAPHWICAGAASNSLAHVENPPMPDRKPVFERLAWAQWTVDEIRSGEPFKRLLGV